MMVLINILSLNSYICVAVAVENGRRAYDELKNEHNDFDLVLLDLYMPEMDGFELLTLMQDDPRLREIPVVIMSASESSDIISNCLSKLSLASRA